jgi:hypothetical protein
VTAAVEMCGGDCTTYLDEEGHAFLNINHGPRMKEIRREDWAERWCFACRGRHMFLYVVDAPVEMSYYGPNPSIRCGSCGQVNGDCGFGRAREWEG